MPNIVCANRFGVSPTLLWARGVIKEIRRLHPEANIVAIDYGAGASETNQINRLKLMNATAKEGYCLRDVDGNHRKSPGPNLPTASGLLSHHREDDPEAVREVNFVARD